MTNVTNSTNTTHDVPPAAGPAIVVGAGPRVSGADAARTIVAAGGTATLATLAVDPPGFPFGSIVSYAIGDVGDPLFFISELAEHTRNLRADSRASLLATERPHAGIDPLSLGRVTLIGSAHPVPDDELATARASGRRSSSRRRRLCGLRRLRLLDARGHGRAVGRRLRADGLDRRRLLPVSRRRSRARGNDTASSST